MKQELEDLDTIPVETTKPLATEGNLRKVGASSK